MADAGADECVAPTGTGVTHSAFITTNETWKAADGVHKVTTSLKIAKGATLTVEPCVVVALSKGVTLTIEGNLSAQGTATKPIVFAATDAANAFGSLSVWAPGTLSLAYATISYGGADTANHFGVIDARGDQLLKAQEILRVDHVTVSGATAYGVSLRAGAAFVAGSTALTIKGAAVAPLRVLPRLVSNLPDGNYTGNAADEIVVETEAYGDVTLEDVTFHDRGVPYRIGGPVSLGTLQVGPATPPVTLTLEPGVTFRFKKGSASALRIDKGSMGVAAKAALVAVGTASKPITFTSAQTVPAPGDWLGIDFGNVPLAANQLEHVQILYAGAASGANGFHCQPNGNFSANEDAALSVYGVPPLPFLKNSHIAHSAALGVNLAYSGAFVDFVPTNTFDMLGSCKTSYPRNANGSCPGSVPCP